MDVLAQRNSRRSGLGRAEHWDRYSYAHVSALIDKRDGEIQRLIDEKGKIPEEQREPLIRRARRIYQQPVPLAEMPA